MSTRLTRVENAGVRTHFTSLGIQFDVIMNGTVYTSSWPKSWFPQFQKFWRRDDNSSCRPEEIKTEGRERERERERERLKKQEIRRHRIYKRAFHFPVACFYAVLLAVMNQLRHFKLRQQRQSEGGVHSDYQTTATQNPRLNSLSVCL